MTAVEQTVHDCDRRLRNYRQALDALDARTNPKVVADWIADVEAERVVAQRALADLRSEPETIPEDVRGSIDEIADKVALIADAEPGLNRPGFDGNSGYWIPTFAFVAAIAA